MNLTAKKKSQRENNGLKTTHSNSKINSSPFKDNEKIIYLPKDFLKKNPQTITPINQPEINISIYKNSPKQPTTNPNSFRCQPNSLRYNKNFYKHPLSLYTTNNITNNTLLSHRNSPNIKVNVSTIERDNSINNNNTSINNTSNKGNISTGHIVSKVISFSNDKLKKLQQDKENIDHIEKDSNENMRCIYNNMIYTRKRSKDGSGLRVGGNEERRKLCKSAKNIQVNKMNETSTIESVVNTNNNSILTSENVDNGYMEIHSSIINNQEQDNVVHEKKFGLNKGEDCYKIDKTHLKSKSTKNYNIKEHEEGNNTKENKHIFSIMNMLSNKENKMNGDDEDAFSKNQNKIKSESVNDKKLLMLLKQNLEKKKALHKHKSHNKNNNVNTNSNNGNQIKNHSSSIDKILHAPLKIDECYKDLYTTPNNTTLLNTKYYEEVSPKQIVCGNIISPPNVSKNNINLSMKDKKNVRNNLSIPTTTENSRENSYEYNYYVYNHLLHNNANAKIKQNLKMASAKVNNDNQIRNFCFTNENLLNKNTLINTNNIEKVNSNNYSEARLVTKHNLKDKLYKLEFNNNVKESKNIESQSQKEDSLQKQQTLFNLKDKKSLIYKYDCMRKEDKPTLNEELSQNTSEQDYSIHKKINSVRDVKERQNINTDDEIVIHKKINSVRLQPNNKNQSAEHYYTLNTQTEKGNVLKNDDVFNTINVEFMSLTNRLHNHMNNISSNVISRTHSKKYNGVNSLNNTLAISSFFNSRYKNNKPPN